MVDGSLSRRSGCGQARTNASARPRWGWPLAGLAFSIFSIVALGGLLHAGIEAYRARVTLTGLVDDPSPVSLTIAGETLSIPANMIRFAETRRGGTVDRIDLVLHWPTLEGYSNSLSEAFKGGSLSTPIIYASIARRGITLDSTARLDHVYERFFVGPPIAGPAGLLGRRLDKDSGYGNEIVYYLPDGPRPFVARCQAEATAEVPSTCLRDVNLGQGLSLLYRFNQGLLGEWQPLDAAIRNLAAAFLRPAP